MGMYTDEQVARVCHETIRALQYIHNDMAPSQPWDCETAELRDSAIAGVRSARSGVTPRQHHQNWVDYKTARGWVYGPVKDTEKRTHPCLVPYDDLPLEQRYKDQVFLMVVTALTVGLMPEMRVSAYQGYGTYSAEFD